MVTDLLLSRAQKAQMTGENINVNQLYLFSVFSVFRLSEISFEREHFLLGVDQLQCLQTVP